MMMMMKVAVVVTGDEPEMAVVVTARPPSPCAPTSFTLEGRGVEDTDTSGCLS